jgi:acetylornithine deacetylase/succinyl-diaminopimelate desuccinylase-like protein
MSRTQSAGIRSSSLAALLFAAFMQITTADAQTLSSRDQLAREIYQELIEINTVTASGDTLRAAEAMAARLRAAGFDAADVQVLSSGPRKGNLVARLRGTGTRKPILLLAHIDVVEAKREDWSIDPFKFTEKDGYFYGRGTIDQKYMAAAFVANLIFYKQDGYRPERDLIMVLETDEEILDRNMKGIRWLLANHRPLIDAEFALNEGGGVGMRDGVPIRNTVQAAEKVSVNFQLEVTNKGGHSSVPSPDNAIYRLAEGLTKLSKFSFPFRINETTRAYFERIAEYEPPQVAQDIRAAISGKQDVAALSVTRLSVNPVYNAQLRTTCVATMLEGGHAGNALPQLARASVNCRMMPGEPVDEVQAALARVVDDEQIKVKRTTEPVPSDPSALRDEVMGAITSLSTEFWPGVAVIPVMSTGGTSATHLRNAGIPTYGHSGLASEIGDNRAHGRDERVLAASFFKGREYLFRLVKALAGGT